MNFFSSVAPTQQQVIIEYIQYGSGNPNILNDYEDISRADNLYLRMAIEHENLDAVKYILNHEHFKRTAGIYNVINEYCDKRDRFYYRYINNKDSMQVKIILEILSHNTISCCLSFDLINKVYTHIFTFDECIEEFKAALEIRHTQISSQLSKHITKLLHICTDNKAPKCAAYVIKKYNVDFETGFTNLLYLYTHFGNIEIVSGHRHSDYFKEFIAKMEFDEFEKFCLQRLETEYPYIRGYIPLVSGALLISSIAIARIMYSI